jgi:hypothetical protein
MMKFEKMMWNKVKNYELSEEKVLGIARFIFVYGFGSLFLFMFFLWSIT